MADDPMLLPRRTVVARRCVKLLLDQIDDVQAELAKRALLCDATAPEISFIPVASTLQDATGNRR